MNSAKTTGTQILNTNLEMNMILMTLQTAIIIQKALPDLLRDHLQDPHRPEKFPNLEKLQLQLL